MYKIKILLLLLPICGMMASCQKDKLPDPTEAVTQHIRFDQMAVGQKSRYLGLTGSLYFMNGVDSFVHHPDTLELRIVAKNNDMFMVEERLFSADSVSNVYPQQQDSTFVYWLFIKNDTLRATDLDNNTWVKSRIFGSLFANEGLPLAAFTNEKADITGWKTSLPYCECFRTAFAENQTVLGRTYERLNIYLNNTFMQVDGPGHTYIYTPGFGIVKFSTYGWWTQTGYGWDLLPE